MKIGAEEKNKVRIMIVCVVLAALSVIYWVRSMNPGAASAGPRPAASGQAAKKAVPQIREITLDPTLRIDMLLASQKVQYDGGKRNIFRMEDPPPPPMPAPVVQVVNTAPPPPPPPPPINLKFFGFSTKPGEPKKVFLSEGEEIFVAKEGDIINRRYKILQINNTSVMVEDMLNNNKQPIPLTAPPTG